MAMKRLQDKVALVTAATRGIGKACAMRLAAEGATVYLGSITLEEGRPVAQEIEAQGGRAKVVYFDALKTETYAAMIDEVVDEAGRLDVLVNNFGGGDPQKDLDLAQSEAAVFFRILQMNLGSVFYPCKAVLPQMLRQGGGSIVNVSSVGAVEPDMSRTAYGVSKAAINFLSKDIAVQYARGGVRCNVVMPGLTLTESLQKNMSREFMDAYLRHVPLGRAGLPEDIAAAAAFLASDDASYVTGETLLVAGGYGVPNPQYADLVRH